MALSGIYRIVNTFNGKSYVGQTNDLARRKNEHLSKLRNGKHRNKKLQEEYNLYKKYFRFEILEYCPYEKLGEREDYWAHHFNCWTNGFNTQDTDSRNYSREKESKNNEDKSVIGGIVTPQVESAPQVSTPPEPEESFFKKK